MLDVKKQKLAQNRMENSYYIEELKYIELVLNTGVSKLQSRKPLHGYPGPVKINSQSTYFFPAATLLLLTWIEFSVYEPGTTMYRGHHKSFAADMGLNATVDEDIHPSQLKHGTRPRLRHWWIDGPARIEAGDRRGFAEGQSKTINHAWTQEVAEP